MTTHYIPPRDQNEDKINKIKESLLEVLRPYITGKNKDDKLEEAVEKSINSIKTHFKLQNSHKGATVMTEKASYRNSSGDFRKGPTNL